MAFLCYEKSMFLLVIIMQRHDIKRIVLFVLFIVDFCFIMLIYFKT